MNISDFFIKRPIFAGVLSIVIFLVGAISLKLLPISEYPEVVPPTVVVRASYPGANPKTISETVAAPLEQAINGVEHSLYMFSQATSDGVMTLTITFKLGTDLDNAQVQVQNRVAQAQPKLPEEVRRLGVTTTKTSPDLLMVVHLFSPDNRYDDIYVRNYATLQVRDVLARLPGVGQVRVFGSGDYAMRVWLNPDKIAAKGLTASRAQLPYLLVIGYRRSRPNARREIFGPGAAWWRFHSLIRTRRSIRSTVAASNPAATISSATVMPSSSCRSQSTTVAPWVASIRAVASPMPDAPPVIMATFPGSRFPDSMEFSIPKFFICRPRRPTTGRTVVQVLTQRQVRLPRQG